MTPAWVEAGALATTPSPSNVCHDHPHYYSCTHGLALRTISVFCSSTSESSQKFSLTQCFCKVFAGKVVNKHEGCNSRLTAFWLRLGLSLALAKASILLAAACLVFSYAGKSVPTRHRHVVVCDPVAAWAQCPSDTLSGIILLIRSTCSPNTLSRGLPIRYRCPHRIQRNPTSTCLVAVAMWSLFLLRGI